MKNKCAKIGLLLAFFVAISPSASAGEPGSLPAVSQITDGVLAWIAGVREEKPLFSFRRIADVEKLDKSGNAKKSKRKVYQSVVIDGANFDRLVSVDGRDPSEEQREKDLERLEDFREHRAERRKEEDPFFDEDLVERFIFDVEGTGYINGRKAFVVGFRPNPFKDLPDDDDKDVLANALAGTLWIDAEDYAVARIKAGLVNPIQIGWGLLADFQKINLDIRFQRVDQGVWFPKDANVYIWGKTLLFKPIRSQQVHRFKDVKRIQ